MGNRGMHTFVYEGKTLPFGISNHWDFEYHTLMIAGEIETTQWGGTDNPDPITAVLRKDDGVVLEWFTFGADAMFNLDDQTVTVNRNHFPQGLDGPEVDIGTVTFDQLRRIWPTVAKDVFADFPYPEWYVKILHDKIRWLKKEIATK